MDTGIPFRPEPQRAAPSRSRLFGHFLNARMAREAGGRFLIRIEDIDTIRCKPALAVAALADLAWLGLTWEEPVRVQSAHVGEYHLVQDRLEAMGVLYPCFCSRRDVSRVATGASDPEGQPLYAGTCRRLSTEERQSHIAQGRPHAWRIDMDAALSRVGPLAFEENGTLVAAAPQAWGDVIVARRDIGTSYHIACVADDAAQGVTHVVRGKDLYLQTAIHRVLQELLGLTAPKYHHHDLIGDEMGRKLSKSAGDRSLRSLRAAGVVAAEIRTTLGVLV